MDVFIIVAMTIMLPIGVAQIISAIALLNGTQHERQRKHFVYYMIGVGLYFLLLFPMIVLIREVNYTVFLSYSFLGALGLMVYHFMGLIKTT